jgi:ribosomal protein S4
MADDTLTLKADIQALSLVGVLKQAGLVHSMSEGRRVIEQGAVAVDGQVTNEPLYKLVAGKTFEVKLGQKVVSIKVIP